MSPEIDFALTKLRTAYAKLAGGSKEAETELNKDGVIQRFEFTFELLWKTLKIVLENKGVITKTPRDSLQEAFRIDILTDEVVFLDMLEDRNKTSHIYDKDTAEEIYIRIKDKYLPAIAEVLTKLDKSSELRGHNT